MTGTAEKLATRAEQLPEGSLRRRALEGARGFKAAWVEFGRLLSEVKRRGVWREWGHASFEQYCAKELFIRRQTAEKLTASFGFLERHEPALVRERPDGEHRAPAFEVVEVLSRAEAAGRLSGSDWKDLREEVLEQPMTPAALGKRLSEKLGPPPPPPRPAKGERLGRLAAAARRLAGACADEDGVPRSLKERAAALARELAALAGDDG
ncbi:MAG: hypothetical protein QM704_18105 [Anaeromyxobacteraceae bacterium]